MIRLLVLFAYGLCSIPRLNASGDSIHAIRTAVAGRLVADTWLSAKEFIRETSYSLASLAQSLLDITHNEIEVETNALYYKDAESLCYLLDVCELLRRSR